MSLIIVIPTTPSRLEILGECVESALECNPLEVIIVTPRVFELEHRFRRDARIKLVQDAGLGAAAAINLGLAAAVDEAKYALWIGDDDRLISQGISASLDQLSQSEEFQGTYGNCIYITNAGDKWNYKPGTGASESAGKILNRIPQPGSVFRKGEDGKFPKLNEGLKYSFDEQLFVDLNRKGKLIYVDEFVATYRWHPGSLSSKNRKAAIREALILRWRSCSWLERVKYSIPWLVIWADSAFPSQRVSRFKNGL
jgi:glycosyltransferase involved in cell wall biosynthesis